VRARFTPSWTFPTVASPTIDEGVLYLTGSGDPGDQAFDAACGASGGACAPLWTMSPDNGASANFATVADDGVFVSGADGNLHVFRIGGSATCCAIAGPAPEARNSLGYLAFYTFVWSEGSCGSRSAADPVRAQSSERPPAVSAATATLTVPAAYGPSQGGESCHELCGREPSRSAS
jgi:hypothetical protein